MMFKICKTINLTTGNAHQKKQEILQYFLDTIDLEDSLYSLIKKEAFYKRPDPLRHPLIFYYGHTLTFYINKLIIGKYVKNRINPTFESQMAIGVDEMSWDDLNQSHNDWPELSTLKNYRKKATQVIVEYITKTKIKLPIQWEDPIWPILMGIEHQRIHIETSSVLIRQLDINFINQGQKQWAPCPLRSEQFPLNQLVPVAGGQLQAGVKDQHPFYAWDNEYGTHNCTLENFSAAKYLVSNGEFNQFLQAGGYQQAQYWSDEGNSWRQFTQAQHPHFWILDEVTSKYKLRCLADEIDMPWNWPAVTNYHEAYAFCNYKSHQLGFTVHLPTEDEWNLLALNGEIPHQTEWEIAPGNINLEHFPSSCPVDHFKFTGGLYDIIGNVWQWASTPIYPYDGIKLHPLYDDFSVPTFDQKHHLMKGGSFISTGNEATLEARYAFRKHFFQHAGFRYVKSNNTNQNKTNIYETDSLLAQYIEFHYGAEYYDTQNFPKTCINKCLEVIQALPQRKKALDLGCALGRSTFELAAYFDHTTGMDFSARFINTASKLLNNDSLKYAIPAEGDLLDYKEVFLSDLQLDLKNKNIDFIQGDACNLASKYGTFDFIFAGNLIDRLYHPKKFLTSIHQYLNSGGVLVLTSPYTWIEEYTPKENWIGGFKKDGENFTTLMGLDEILSHHFKREMAPTRIPFVIRETARKFQHTCSEMTIWRKFY